MNVFAHEEIHLFWGQLGVGYPSIKPDIDVRVKKHIAVDNDTTYEVPFMALAAFNITPGLTIVRLTSLPRRIWVPKGFQHEASLVSRIKVYLDSCSRAIFPFKVEECQPLAQYRNTHAEPAWNAILVGQSCSVTVECKKKFYYIQGQMNVRAILWVNSTDTYSVYVKGHGTHILRLAPRP